MEKENERGILKKVRAIVPAAARRLTRQAPGTKPLQKVNGLSVPETTFALCFKTDVGNYIGLESYDFGKPLLYSI